MSIGLITLRDDRALVQIAPAWGGALTRYEIALEPTLPMRPVLRPWDEELDGGQNLFSMACNVLLPWSNRIGAEGFSFEGNFYPVAPNVSGESHPLHGNGFQSRWDVVWQNPNGVELRLLSDSCKPFDYEARLRYTLVQGALTINLSVNHRGSNALPYGIGLHPWFVRTVDSVLSFDANQYWSETADHLPLQRLSIEANSILNFSAARPIPNTWLNTAFEGWGRSAALMSKTSNLFVEMSASESFSNLLVFSPNGSAGFVCIEPISHIPNAHCIAGLTEATALTRLERGQSLEGWLSICPRPYPH